MILRTALSVAALALCISASVLAVVAQDEKPAGKDEKSEFDRPDPPEEFKKLEVPDLSDADRIASGKKLFEKNCVTCHGEDAKGDTPTGKALKPEAGDLTKAELHDAVSDAYLYWRISKGSAAIGEVGMTPYEDQLKEAQRWELVAYLRSLDAGKAEDAEVAVLDDDQFEELMDGLKDAWKNLRAHATEREQEKTQAEADKIVELASKLKGYDGEVKSGEQKGEKVREQQDFKKFCEDFAAAASEYAKLVKAGDWEKTDAAQGKIGEGCKSCHDVYKKKRR